MYLYLTHWYKIPGIQRTEDIKQWRKEDYLTHRNKKPGSKTLVPAFVSCRLDYCNSLFFGNSDGLITQLQATGTPACQFQSCHSRSSVAVWKFCVTLSWWLLSCRSWATTTLHRELNTAGHTSLLGPQHLRWQKLLQLLVPGYGTVYRHISEMLTYCTVTSGSHRRHFCWMGHGAVRSILTVSSRNNLTYLCGIQRTDDMKQWRDKELLQLKKTV